MSDSTQTILDHMLQGKMCRCLSDEGNKIFGIWKVEFLYLCWYERDIFKFIGDTNITMNDFVTLQHKKPLQNIVE